MAKILLIVGFSCSLLCLICFVIFASMIRRRDKTEHGTSNQGSETHEDVRSSSSAKSTSLCIHMADRDCSSQDGIYCRAVPCVKDLSKVVESCMGVSVRKRNTDGVGMFI